MQKRKVLHFELDFNIGGIESFLLNLYRKIDRESIQFDFVTESSAPAFENQFQELGGTIHTIHEYKNIISYRKDIKELLKLGYDVIHVHKNSATNIIPLLEAKQFKNLRVIVHSHNTAPSKGTIFKVFHKINQKKLYDLANYHLACSKIAGEWMYGDKKFDIVRNGIDTRQFLFDENKGIKVREKLGLTSTDFVIGHIGRFTEQKNHTKLIEIFSEILLMKPNCVLVLIGEGPMMLKIKEKISKLRIEDKVKILGNRNDVSELMQAMDAFIMPSLYEGLPIVAIEAQAAGLYVYLSDQISTETEISDMVSWFELNMEYYDLARMIIEKGRPNSETRKTANKSVSSAGYDMQMTCKYMTNLYLEQQPNNV